MYQEINLIEKSSVVMVGEGERLGSEREGGGAMLTWLDAQCNDDRIPLYTYAFMVL